MATEKLSAQKKSSKKIIEKKSSKTTKNTVKSFSNSISNFFEKIIMPKNLALMAGEMIGSFLLASVFIISGGQPIPIFFGLTAIVLMLGMSTGAHVNPLITVGSWATRKISSVKAVSYIIAQFLGAMLAFISIKSFMESAVPAEFVDQLSGQIFSAIPLIEGKEILVFIAELVGSAIFAFGVAQISSKASGKSAGMALGIGGSLFIAALVAGSLTQIIAQTSNIASQSNGTLTILNPSLALSLQAFTIEGTNFSWALLIYIGAAILGGILGFTASHFISKYSQQEN